MAQVILTIRVMPESLEVDLENLNSIVTEMITKFGAAVGRFEFIPVAFGLRSLNITFIMDESVGDTEPLEKDISDLDDVASVEVIDVRRAVG